MRITIQTDDKLVYCDGIAVPLPTLDWGHESFTGDPGTVLDDVAAVQFDTEAGQGHIEYRTLITKQFNRPNVRPPDCPINGVDFNAQFGWVLPFYYEERDRLRQLEEQRQAQLEERARLKEQLQDSVEQEVNAASAEELEAVKAQNAALQERLDGVESALAALYEENQKALKGEE